MSQRTQETNAFTKTSPCSDNNKTRQQQSFSGTLLLPRFVQRFVVPADIHYVRLCTAQPAVAEWDLDKRNLCFSKLDVSWFISLGSPGVNRKRCEHEFVVLAQCPQPSESTTQIILVMTEWWSTQRHPGSLGCVWDGTPGVSSTAPYVCSGTRCGP